MGRFRRVLILSRFRLGLDRVRDRLNGNGARGSSGGFVGGRIGIGVGFGGEGSVEPKKLRSRKRRGFGEAMAARLSEDVLQHSHGCLPNSRRREWTVGLEV